MHALLVAAIFVTYFGSMTALMGYMAGQVRHREQEPDQDLADLDVRDDDDPGTVGLAA